ncbi:TetR/AcrR family transcriptional regulator [Paenibacillaceae bacterium WGS1546]|uniref:TetR/AcrR family transcriptional regulator n=1 Tax=Cohnella sp. WGS1546 TaxID=3366810 RepID=UPI00372D7D1F
MTDNDKQGMIVEAAYQVLAEKGYDQASTKEIARVAGVAQGLIYYYFPNKDLLYAEVFRRDAERYCESLNFIKQIGDRPLTSEAIRSALSVPKQRALEQRTRVKLRYELYALGLRNPSVSESIKKTLAIKRKHLQDLVASVTKLPEEHARPLSAILLATFDGLGLQRLSDDSFEYDEAYDTLATMIESYIKQAFS